MASSQLFFPEFLNQGSSGPAVRLLQLLLIMGGYNSVAIIPDGDYGEETAKGVRLFQDAVGFNGADVDGNFGPATRKVFLEWHRINVNAIPADAFEGETMAVIP